MKTKEIMNFFWTTCKAWLDNIQSTTLFIWLKRCHHGSSLRPVDIKYLPMQIMTSLDNRMKIMLLLFADEQLFWWQFVYLKPDVLSNKLFSICLCHLLFASATNWIDQWTNFNGKYKKWLSKMLGWIKTLFI